MQGIHIQFNLKECGLIVHPNYPLFGASPDGLSEYNCCGKGCIEIKCPYSLKDGKDFNEILKLKDPYLLYDDETKRYEINQQHTYFFQIQMQIFLADVQFCDFCIWSPKEMLVLRIFANNEFWVANSQKAKTFATSVLLPEILRNIYSNTRRNIHTSTN